MMTELRRLVYKFLTLPYDTRLKIAVDLNLIEPDPEDEGVHGDDLWKRVCLRVRTLVTHKDFSELKNLHQFALTVWGVMLSEHVGYSRDIKYLTQLWKDQSIPGYQRAVLMMTNVYDLTYVIEKDFKRAARDIDEFFKAFPTKREYAKDWHEIKRIFETSDRHAIGFEVASFPDGFFDLDTDSFVEKHGFFTWDWAVNLYEKLDI